MLSERVAENGRLVPLLSVACKKRPEPLEIGRPAVSTRQGVGVAGMAGGQKKRAGARVRGGRASRAATASAPPRPSQVSSASSAVDMIS